VPYIEQKDRPAIDAQVTALARAIEADGARDAAGMAGPLNYACTALVLKLYPKRKYWTLALVIGVFVTVVLEYYRRWGGPYEDQKIAENGDVYPEG
jgi:hypothetical protein